MKKTRTQIRKEKIDKKRKINHVKKLAKKISPKATPREIFIEYGIMRIKKHLKAIQSDLAELYKVNAEVDFVAALGSDEVHIYRNGTITGTNFLGDMIKKEVMEQYCKNNAIELKEAPLPAK